MKVLEEYLLSCSTVEGFRPKIGTLSKAEWEAYYQYSFADVFYYYHSPRINFRNICVVVTDGNIPPQSSSILFHRFEFQVQTRQNPTTKPNNNEGEKRNYLANLQTRKKIQSFEFKLAAKEVRDDAEADVMITIFDDFLDVRECIESGSEYCTWFQLAAGQKLEMTWFQFAAGQKLVRLWNVDLLPAVNNPSDKA
ncbi:hypothetical protein OUZ56_024749 [Daphnia magna]|uniref:Uncharacterized protein n=1 Tax=Daphnia magna TaxID=35525 RepID=A0ABQ9ZHX0_9CRUS|nr:hypothetical protein OUZ56_024749 [Daphnia magna]